MTPVYKHNDTAYIILRQKWVHYFSRTIDEAPDMEFVQLFMQAIGADHVLRTQTHFMFCVTVPDIDFEIVE